MCLIAFAIGAVPGHPLLIASNRDEHLARPTLPLHAWQLDNGTPVVAGRDQHAGGTWLGVTPQGRVAMLTNVREAGVLNAPQSRGELVTGWLQGTQGWGDFALGVDAGQYSGFNLVLGDLVRGEWAWITNRRPAQGDTQALEALGSVVGRPLAAGVYGLSNAALDTPWPKTQQLKQALWSVVDRSSSTLAADWRKPLLAALLDRQQAAADALPSTGAPRVWEQALSSPFVDYAERHYGTRSSLLVCASADEVQMEEWTHERTAPLDETSTSSRWPLAHSTYRRMCISMCGMPASSNGSPLTV
ncbi:MAG: NRDE family protein [Hydrogenophaga sp.]|nr:NRDE family protein [Hydrogenophaga sp.]